MGGFPISEQRGEADIIPGENVVRTDYLVIICISKDACIIFKYFYPLCFRAEYNAWLSKEKRL